LSRLLLISVYPLYSILLLSFFFLLTPLPPTSTLFPYTTLFRSSRHDSDPTESQAIVWSVVWISANAARFVCHARKPCGVRGNPRSEEHTSELQSRSDLVCRLLLEKKKKTKQEKTKI